VTLRTATPPDGETPQERNTVLLIVVGVLAAISVVVAALVIFSSGGEPAEKPAARAEVRATDHALVVGRDDASSKVVVYENLGSADSRELDLASRDFLRIEAARGQVQVTYVVYSPGDADYGAEALRAWAGVLSAGTPQQALAFKDVLLDRQSDAGTPTPSQLVEWAKDAGIRAADVHAAMARDNTTYVDAANQAASSAGARLGPLVVLDGKPLSADSPTALADRLQREVLARER
jgi:hypothetical protein